MKKKEDIVEVGVKMMWRWNDHPDHAEMADIYESCVPKISYDVEKALDKLSGGTYLSDLKSCVDSGNLFREEEFITPREQRKYV
jgi:hypothetical protein